MINIRDLYRSATPLTKRYVAIALVTAQLESGGWPDSVPETARERASYHFAIRGGGGDNRSTLDDNDTQGACHLLMEVDNAGGQSDILLHDATLRCLDSIVAAQFSNGGWPQRYDGSDHGDVQPDVQASYPGEWPHEFPGGQYTWFPTTNDNVMVNCVKLLWDAADVYSDSSYAVAANRGCEFLLRAQMPDPQPAWCQQYSLEMQPVWARKFEPPAVTGYESQVIVELLLEAHRRTGDRRFADAAIKARDYLLSSVLPDGWLARFYELETNTPLYLTRDYVLTYDDSDTPTHYTFKVRNRLA